jgi:hypothetical protein
MSNFKIFLQSGKLMIGEFPEQPEFKGDYFLHYGPQKQYEAAVEAAKASAVEVLSENCDNVFGARCLRGTNN